MTRQTRASLEVTTENYKVHIVLLSLLCGTRTFIDEKTEFFQP